MFSIPSCFFVVCKYTPRKIKVVDVVPDNSNETAIDNTVQQLQIDTNQQVEDNEIQSVQIKEDVEQTIETDHKTGNITEEQQIEKVPTTEVRTNELHECNKCGKFMTLKTLEYTHENTCSVKEPPPEPEKPTPKPKGRPKNEIVVEKLPPVKEEREVQDNKEVQVFAPEPRKSFEEMRKDRLRERVHQRTQRISNLFYRHFEYIKICFINDMIYKS